ERCESPVELRSLKLRHMVKYGDGRRFCQERKPGSQCREQPPQVPKTDPPQIHKDCWKAVSFAVG
ncbi:MAG: hypothetical protein JWQ55_2008, partial [Rhodopila sp.]|nr:hypothetical protein [Rhodopila sp.]